MKNKPYLITYALLFCCAVIIAATIITYASGNHVAFAVLLILGLAAIAASLYSIIDFKGQCYKSIKRSENALRLRGKGSPRGPLSCMTVDENGRIIWYNETMKKEIFKGRDFVAASFDSVFPDADLNLMADGKADLIYEDKILGAWTSKSQDKTGVIYSIYINDETVLRKTYKEYYMSRPTALHIMIDNMDDLLRNSKASEKAQLSVQIETILERWIGNTSGFYERTDNDSFLAVMEERHIKQIIDSKFSVLDEVRALSVGGDHRNATLSIGVGRGGKTLKACEDMAQEALEMALGRGGDQAAVRTADGYEFYGGVSKGIEKRSKVRTRSIAGAMTRLISKCDNVLVMGHKNSDFDSVGACVGLWRAVRTLGKPCNIVLDRNTSLAKPLISRIDDMGIDDIIISPEEAMQRVGKKTILMVADTHNKKIVESAELVDSVKTVIVIDHHRKMVDFIDNTIIFFHEPLASSACEMVSELLQYMDDSTLSKTDAEALLAGIMLDTKNFTMRTGVRTFEAAAYLRKKGADTISVKELFNGSIEDYRLKARIISSAKMYKDCAIACIESQSGSGNIRLCSAQAADELLSIEDADASFVLYPDANGVSISARSLGRLNVQLVAEALGGGGHQTMAGAQLKNVTMQQAVKMLTDAIDKV
ncbi:MAG: DHH family phosphoesterase [Clostridia bacterium]|nr:DHH family phosphoesterase [Clostridia bacterium]